MNARSTLDKDNSNSIMKDEFAGFMRRAPPRPKAKPKPKEIKSTLDELRDGFAIASQPTSEMREELNKAGVQTLLTDDELKALATNFSEWIEEWRYNEHKPPSTTWFNLYAEIDKDGSGFITYDELTDAVRRKLKVKPSTLSTTRLKALWW